MELQRLRQLAGLTEAVTQKASPAEVCAALEKAGFKCKIMKPENSVQIQASTKNDGDVQMVTFEPKSDTKWKTMVGRKEGDKVYWDSSVRTTGSTAAELVAIAKKFIPNMV